MTMKSKIAIERDDNWLLSRLDHIWSKYFSDIPQTNKVFIKFGRNAKFRLGSIKLKQTGGAFGTKASHITITAMFKDTKIPAEVVDHTIGHELTHYAHGFSSTNPRLHKHPHAGGVVKREMTERGMELFYEAYKSWIKEYRKQIMDSRYKWKI